MRLGSWEMWDSACSPLAGKLLGRSGIPREVVSQIILSQPPNCRQGPSSCWSSRDGVPHSCEQQLPA